MLKFSRLVTLIALLTLWIPGAAAQDDMQGPNVIVTLAPTPFAEAAGLAGVSARAHVISDEGFIHITLESNGAALPDGTVLEGWVVDAGLDGGPGQTNASDADETFGTSFGDEGFDAAVEAAPYALSTGVLTATESGTWEVSFTIPYYNFSPYDAVVVTAESDGNDAMGFDPRPGTPMFAGEIASGEPAGDDMMMDDSGDDMSDDMSEDVDANMDADMSEDDDSMSSDMSDDSSMDDTDGEAMDSMDDDTMADDSMMMSAGITVKLDATPLAEGAGLAAVSGEATVYVDDGALEITLTLNGAVLPDGAVLEGWVVDAGLNGGPGTSSVSDLDEVFGVSFGDENFDALVESAPYALSTGVLYDNMDGTYTLSFHVPGYDFSPYDAVVITLESDGNTTNGFDPRPGTPVLAGEITSEM